MSASGAGPGLTFLLYGLFGWCAEIVWTAGYDLVSGTRRAEGDVVGRVPMTRPERLRLAGRTYLWMLPIYGAGGLCFELVYAQIGPWHWLLRGLVYAVGAFVIEGAAGLLLKALTGRCPWDYSYNRTHIAGVIRLDYTPVWAAFGLVLERVHAVLVSIAPHIQL
jgi:Putative ABC-transporter type IV